MVLMDRASHENHPPVGLPSQEGLHLGDVVSAHETLRVYKNYRLVHVNFLVFHGIEPAI